MKSVITSYELEVAAMQDIEIPHGSALLSVQVIKGIPYLFVLVMNTEAEKEIVRLRTIDTDSLFELSDFDPRDFLGTYQLMNGDYIAHVFHVA